MIIKRHSMEYLRECFSVDCEKGCIVWKIRPEHHFRTKRGQLIANGRNALKEAGSIDSIEPGKKRATKYKSIGVNGARYKYHHVIWLFHTGLWPTELDHISGNGLDNRILNLREATSSENSRNLPLSSRNKSGVSGLHWVKQERAWTVGIGVNGKWKYLGIFKDKQEAINVRKAAEKKYGYHQNHGKKKELRC